MEKLILSEIEVEELCKRVAAQMDKQMDEDGSNLPVLLGIMNGALPFMYQLVKNIKHPNEIDTMQVSSYNGTASTGELIIKKKPDRVLEGKDVYIIEDIIDTGLTMHLLRKYIMETYKPRHLYVVIMVKRAVDKPHYQEVADFTGVVLEEQRYIVGYGFDYYGIGRCLPYVFVPSEDDFKKWDEILLKDNPDFKIAKR
ncbi:MAG: hypothetical protein MJ228_01465 [Bacilli bacterium]|nr:hypothetical protein [Bacilli bacterium]